MCLNLNCKSYYNVKIVQNILISISIKLRFISNLIILFYLYMYIIIVLLLLSCIHNTNMCHKKCYVHS